MLFGWCLEICKEVLLEFLKGNITFKGFFKKHKLKTPYN